MSNYNGRRGPNVSQYLRELSSINTQEAAAPEEPYGLDEDLTMFTNTSFFDIETGMNTDFQSQPGKTDTETLSSDDPTSASIAMDELSNIDFMSGDFNFQDFGAAYTSPTLHNFSDSIGNNLQPIQPNPQSIYPAPPQRQHQLSPQNGTRQSQARLVSDSNNAGRAAGNSSSLSAAASTGVGSRRPPSSNSRPMMSLEEGSRLAAEEDKRRRNTAASARFRIKKKQREQALEKSAKEMNAKMTALESQITTLEMENKWLKNLIMEKNQGNEDIAKLWQDFNTKHKMGAAGEAAGETKKPVPVSPEEHEASEMTG